MSSALSRLRALFADELFVRTPREMRPTPRALELAEPVGDALRHVRSALERPAIFNPATAERRFTIGAADNADFSVAPALAQIWNAAPRIAIEVVMAERASALTMLDDGALDLAIGHFQATPKRFMSATLYSERYVCLCNRNLVKVADRLTLESFTALPHLHVAAEGAGHIDKSLAARGLERRVMAVVPHFASVPYALEHAGFLAVVGERIGRRFAALPWIAVHEVPFAQDPWTISAVWSRRADADPAITWFRTRLQTACAGL